MKHPMLTPAIVLSLAIVLAPFGHYAKAELVSEEVQEDTITPDSLPAMEKDVVVVKKASKLPTSTKKKVVMQQEETYEPTPMIAPSAPTAVAISNSSSVSNAEAEAQARPSVGSALDKGIKTKMDEVQGKFEDAILKSLDRIKVTVDDGSSSPDASAVAAPVQTTTIVQDSVVTTKAAPDTYMSVDAAPAIADDEEEEGGESIAEAKEEKSSAPSSVRLSPVIGWTTINSDVYNIDSRYTAGIQLEADINESLAAVLGYSYSQYDISLATANPFFGSFNPGFNQGNTNSLTYNQNVFDAGLRFYLFPRESKFRLFLGGGMGYNKGYLNYKQGVFNTYAANQYSNLQDYVVTSYLGIMETGAELSVAKNVAIGANFKYANVLSSSENQPLNNYGFTNNGFGSSISQDQRVVGGSIAENSFYSVLGTVKVSF